MLMQADKLLFIASHAAVEKHGNQHDVFDGDIAALCEAQQREDNNEPEDVTCQGVDYEQH